MNKLGYQSITFRFCSWCITIFTSNRSCQQYTQ